MTRSVLASAAASLALAPFLHAQAEYTQIDGLGIGADLTPDGQFMLLQIGYVWEPSGTFTDITGVQDVVGLAAGGNVAAGNFNNGTSNVPARYDGTSWIDLGGISGSTGCGADLGSAYDISTDGTTVVGLAWDGCSADAFRYDTATGLLVALPSGGTESARANCTNADGSVIGGWDRINNSSTNKATRWDAAGVPTALSTERSEVWDFTPDGGIAVGFESNAACYWDATNTITTLPILPGYETAVSVALGVSEDGGTIVGRAGGGFFSIPSAFLWREDVGTVDLNVLAAELGAPVDPFAMTLASAEAVSADGNTIAGSAAGMFFPTNAYYLVLPDAWLRTDGVTGISVASGGSQVMTLNAGPEQAGRFYLMLGSLSGTSPGIGAGSSTLPLNFDAYTNLLLTSPNTLVANSFGSLDGLGSATATLNIPAGTNPNVAGLTMNHAYVVLDITTILSVAEVSNPQAVDLLP